MRTHTPTSRGKMGKAVASVPYQARLRTPAAHPPRTCDRAKTAGAVGSLPPSRTPGTEPAWAHRISRATTSDSLPHAPTTTRWKAPPPLPAEGIGQELAHIPRLSANEANANMDAVNAGEPMILIAPQAQPPLAVPEVEPSASAMEVPPAVGSADLDPSRAKEERRKQLLALLASQGAGTAVNTGNTGEQSHKPRAAAGTGDASRTAPGARVADQGPPIIPKKCRSAPRASGGTEHIPRL